LEGRIARLAAYERWRPATPIDFEGIVGREAWRAYWERLAAMDRTLAECQACAVELGRAIAAARHGVMRVSGKVGDEGG